MAFAKGNLETGSLQVGGDNIEISRVLTQRKNMFIDLPEGQAVGNFTEILKGKDEKDNIGVLEVNGQVIKGKVVDRRRKYDRPHRQSVFIAESGFEVIISSDEV